MNQTRIAIRWICILFCLVFSVQSHAADILIRDDGTFFDSSNGLIWQADESAAMPWLDAVHYCNQLEFAGMNGWRMPLREELLSFRKWFAQQPRGREATDQHQDTRSWSLSLFSDNNGLQQVWTVNFPSGQILQSSLDAKNVRVRCLVETVEAVYLPLLKRWANAWSNQDAAGYLDCYGTDFVPDNAQSRTEWTRQRTERLLAPEFIHVDLTDIKVLSEEDNRTDIMFLQSYRSNGYRDQVAKILSFGVENGELVIIGEKVVADVQ